MYLPETYSIAVVFMFLTMFCWGSWANTQKLAKGWRFELFYWDYVFGILLTSLLFGFTLGSTGAHGQAFLSNWQSVDQQYIVSAIWGGVIFNAGNILLVAAIALAGMAVAFPVAIGIALVLGTSLNYLISPQGGSVLLALGIAFVLAAIVLDAKVYQKAMASSDHPTGKKGLMVAVISGVLIGLFYPLVARSMEGPLSLTPYTALFAFSIGVLVSNFVFNSILMRKPVDGAPVSYGDYFKGSFKEHFVGILGGSIWCVGMALNLIAAQQAGPAIAYAFGQGATLIAAIWGVFIWREFAGAKGVTAMLALMFACYVAGIGFIGMARVI
ncbi:MAG: multidrug DMT transporter permease [Legionellales bacterium]|nr:multidrug DMT transporter permease [Legionellales bacterium]